MRKWLSIVGIGEDGLAGVSPVARSLIAHAEVLVGGDRHLAMLAADDAREKLTWTSPIKTSLEAILRRRGQSVCVLASGDPMCYGIGVTLTRRLAVTEMTIIPAPSAFSLACARMGWSLTDVETVSLCGRDPALLHAERRGTHASACGRKPDATWLWEQSHDRARTHGRCTRTDA
jgi:precorrin-6B C5,15-methyltransferase / cobalt-precorrin-6B C5,C15-methyltransferase